MEKITPLKKTTVINFDNFVNKDTGETMSSEIKPGTTVKVMETTNMSKVDYEEYAVISIAALDELMRILNNSDLANVIKMGKTVRAPLNILYNYNIPHTNDTLRGYLEIDSKSMFIKLIRRLMNLGILYQIKGLIRGEVRAIYLLNPFICRRGNNFDNRVLAVFEKFRSEVKE
jgi:hypothetical protein